MSVAIVGDDELSFVLQDDGDIEDICSNSSSHPSTTSNNIAVGVLIGVVDDDDYDGNDDVIITPLQQQQTANVDSMIMIGLETTGSIIIS